MGPGWEQSSTAALPLPLATRGDPMSCPGPTGCLRAPARFHFHPLALALCISCFPDNSVTLGPAGWSRMQGKHFPLERNSRVTLEGGNPLIASSQEQALELQGSPSPISDMSPWVWGKGRVLGSPVCPW